ncbi:putative 2' [Tropilaelaps mercedesae]|uniref:Putative 2 n=1 Tax=Tropilaelaps mercedesae TaxID=418985 RepID=A0A1V9X040_9ACAR|nr:putative 2' [Tropilaelaps mercedesae]
MTSIRGQGRVAFVKLDDEKERLTISFKYESEYVTDRLFTFNRKQDETIEKSLNRLQAHITTTAMKKFLKKRKSAKKNLSTLECGNNSSEEVGSKATGANGIIVEDVEQDEELFKLKVAVEDLSGTIMEPSTHNREAFRTGHALNIGNTKFLIIVNAPTVVRISLPKVLISGCPVQAYVTLEHANLSDCVFSWWRSSIKDEEINDYGESNVIRDKSTTWLRIYGEVKKVYWPKKEDEGRKIMVYCTPRSGLDAGVEISAISSSSVIPPLDRCQFEDRHQLTATVVADNLLRVVSYNLLANVYANTKYSKNVLFNYCSIHALDFEYRKHLLIKELLGYNGDVLCLQEVDRGMFKHELLPYFTLQGFEGIYAEKRARASEGILTI